MNRVTLAEVARALSVPCEPNGATSELTGVSLDSRTVEPGQLFFALPGSRVDGHDFIHAAWQRGAAGAVIAQSRCASVQASLAQAALADQSATHHGAITLLPVADVAGALTQLADWYRQRIDPLVIGVTGSVGKTTTRELIHAVMSPAYHGMRSARSFNNELGLPLSLLSITSDDEYAVLELGAAAIGQVRALANLARPEMGVVTAIGQAHLRGFGSQAGVAQGKGELIEALPPGGLAVLPGDDPWTRGLAARAGCPVCFVGEGADNDVRATHVREGRGLEFQIERQPMRLRWQGRHFLTGALCAIAIARETGVSLPAIAEALASVDVVPGRCEPLTIGPYHLINDCYNASPSAVRAALKLLSDWPVGRGRRLAVLGDMLDLGAASPDEHAAIGRLLPGTKLDGVLLFGQEVEALGQAALAEGFSRHRLASCRDLETLCCLLECWLEPGDVLLLKGSRSMQLERVIAWLREREAGSDRRYSPAA